MEEWRDVPGLEGKYQISISTKEGKCRRLYKNGNINILSNTIDGRYISWGLSYNGKTSNHQAAVWIALTYPELVQNEWFEGAEIDHIDTDRLNNHPSNLRWVDRKDQMNNVLTKIHMSESQKGRMITTEHRNKISLSNSGKLLNRKDQSKWVIKLSKDNEILHFYPSISQASRETKINLGCIGLCCQGKRKTAGGFIWKYAE